MPKYLIQASYTVEGVSGLLKEGGSGRKKAVESAVKKLGGKLEAFYYAFGETDVFSIVELPDASAATSLALTVAKSGSVRIKTTVLITPDEVDKAVKKTVTYRAPGA